MTSRRRILVVDDNAQNRELAFQALTSDDQYEVDLAASGAEALKLFAERAADCVLLDIRMPEMSGLETCAQLRRLPGGAEVPILFFTAQRDLDTFDQAIAAGGDDFLTKPLRPTELSVRVQTALKIGHLGKELQEQAQLVRQQRDQLMRLQLQKERLIAFLVHDLKSPVGAVDLHAQLLTRELEAGTPGHESAEHIRSEALYLGRLISNLLHITRAEEGALQPRAERLDPKQLVADTMMSMSVRAKLRAVRLASEVEAELPAVRGDGELLARVLENLVDNAIRHSPRGEQILISARQDQGGLEIAVADRGPGVPAEMRDRILQIRPGGLRLPEPRRPRARAHLLPDGRGGPPRDHRAPRR